MKNGSILVKFSNKTAKQLSMYEDSRILQLRNNS